MNEFWYVFIFTIVWTIFVGAQLWNKEAVGYGFYPKEENPIIYKVIISIHIMLLMTFLSWFLKIINVL